MIMISETHRFQLIAMLLKNWSTKTCWEKLSVSSSATSCNKKNPENDAVLAQTYFKYVRVQDACLLTCDRSKTLELTIDLAL